MCFVCKCPIRRAVDKDLFSIYLLSVHLEQSLSENKLLSMLSGASFVGLNMSLSQAFAGLRVHGSGAGNLAVP